MKLKLRRYNLPGLKDDSVVVYIAPRNSGKTTLLIDTLRYHTSIPVGVVISPTESANHNFQRVCPKMLIYDEYEPGIIQRFVERQRKIMAQYHQEIKQYGKTDLDPRAFLILDDCLYDNTWQNDKNIRFIFLNGRHLKIFLLITMQYPLGIPPILRANVDCVFLARNAMVKEREKLYHHYAGMFPTFDAFCQVMNSCTENYECLVIDKKTQSNRLEDQVFWYKANMNVDFRLCSKQLWDMQQEDDCRRALGYSHNPEEGDDEVDYDPNIVKRNKSAPIIHVKKEMTR